MSVVMDRISFSYGKLAVLTDVTWSLPDAGVVCLWGPSGCGKTTVLRLLAGLAQPSAGRIIGAEKVSMVFQEDRLLPGYSALDNVMLVGADRDVALRMLHSLGLTDEEAAAPWEHLSGGQQRRVALARALVADSELLLLDEPFNGLDVGTWRDVVPLLKEVARSRPVVLVTHVPEQIQALEATVVSLTEMPQKGEWLPQAFFGENTTEHLTNDGK